jgi:hypothetical protein
VLDVLGGARRRAVAPQAVDQLVRGDGTVGAQRKHREHRALLASPQGNGSTADVGIDAPEHPDLQCHFWLTSL